MQDRFCLCDMNRFNYRKSVYDAGGYFVTLNQEQLCGGVSVLLFETESNSTHGTNENQKLLRYMDLLVQNTPHIHRLNLNAHNALDESVDVLEHCNGAVPVT